MQRFKSGDKIVRVKESADSTNTGVVGYTTEVDLPLGKGVWGDYEFQSAEGDIFSEEFWALCEET